MSCIEKRLYITEREAIKALLRVKKIHGVRQRIYNCGRCRGWHLTSRVLPYQEKTINNGYIVKEDWLD